MAMRVSIIFVSVTLVLGGFVQTALADMEDWRRPLAIPFPDSAPYDPRIAGLGKMLFFDPRLSGAQNISCATCHNPSFGWEAPVDRAVGAANFPLPRSAPTTLNMAWAGDLLFWDGRAHGLEEQAKGPIEADAEMNSSFDQIRLRLGGVAEYKQWFDQLFPDEGMTEATIKRALATFERTIVAGWSPFDRWVDGDKTAISESAQRGFVLFTTTGHCSECHSGWNFSSAEFDDIGLQDDDLGRQEITHDPADAHKFKSPSLRNISLRAPYMHNGSLLTLEDVVRHYSKGGVNRPTRAPEIKGFKITDEQVADLVAFLESLTEEETVVFTPILPTN
jgi:cytochrome c peroxidase